MMLFSFSKEINYTKLETIDNQAHFIFTAQKKQIIFFLKSDEYQTKRAQMRLIAGSEKCLSIQIQCNH